MSNYFVRKVSFSLTFLVSLQENDYLCRSFLTLLIELSKDEKTTFDGIAGSRFVCQCRSFNGQR